MSRKQQTLRPSASPPLLSSPPPRARGLMLAWLAALLAARWLIPTEGAVEGMTLWLV